MAFTGSFAGDPFKDPFHVFPLFLVSLSLFLVLSSLPLVSVMVSARYPLSGIGEITVQVVRVVVLALGVPY